MPNIVYGRLGDLAIMVAGPKAPLDMEWDRYVDFLEAMGTPGPSSRTLAISAGGAPTNPQRARLEKRIGAKRTGSKLAVVTSSTFARGVLNGWALVHPGYRAFAPDKLDEAMRFLDIAPTSMRDVEALTFQLQAELGSLRRDPSVIPA